MGLTTEQILANADKLAQKFEDYEPCDDDRRSAWSLRVVKLCVLQHADATRSLVLAVKQARADDHSWSSIGAMLGMSADAAKEQYAPMIDD